MNLILVTLNIFSPNNKFCERAGLFYIHRQIIHIIAACFYYSLLLSPSLIAVRIDALRFFDLFQLLIYTYLLTGCLD